MKSILCVSALLWCSLSYGQTLQSNSKESKLETVNPEKIEVVDETNEIQSTKKYNIKKKKGIKKERPAIINSSEPVSTEKKIKQKP